MPEDLLEVQQSVPLLVQVGGLIGLQVPLTSGYSLLTVYLLLPNSVAFQRHRHFLPPQEVSVSQWSGLP